MKKILLSVLPVLLVVAVFRSLQPSTPTSQTDSAGPEALPEEDTKADLQIIERFELEGFDEKGDRLWELQGDYAHMTEANHVFIEKDVLLTLMQKTVVEADKVYWQSDKSRFITNRPVKITHDTLEVEGKGALGKLDDRFLQLNQSIRMFLENGAVITCHGPLKIYLQEERLVMYRNVMVIDERGAVFADRMDVFFDPDARKIKKIVARENVRIQRDDDVTYAEVAIYDTETQSVRLEGEPEIVVRDPDGLHEEAYGI